MENNETVYKWLAIILAILLVVVGIMWMSARNDLGDALTQLNTEVRDYRADIAEKCGGMTPAQMDENKECRELLQDLTETLQEYQQRIEEIGTSTVTATTTTTAP